jgi:hypothetical protein
MAPSPAPHRHLSLELPRQVQRAGALLEAGIPLTLLIDLVDPAGPHSREVYAEEKADLEWLSQGRRS